MNIIDSVLNADILFVLKAIPSDSVDLIITKAPPARVKTTKYGSGISEDDYPSFMMYIANEIHRILKPTGSFVLNIKENVYQGYRSTYVLKTVLSISKLFCWNDTYIWDKTNSLPNGNKNRLKDSFEYCHLFTKVNKGYKFNSNSTLTLNGVDFSLNQCSNVIRCPSTLSKDPLPEDVVSFFIKLLTDEGDIVLDPFSGVGTSLISAKKLGRHYIGIESQKEYCDIANKALEQLN